MCPYIEKGDGRCLRNLNLNNIERAVGLCASQYRACPVYLRLRASDGGSSRERSVLTQIKA
jgi:hypothetical protein